MCRCQSSRGKCRWRVLGWSAHGRNLVGSSWASHGRFIKSAGRVGDWHNQSAFQRSNTATTLGLFQRPAVCLLRTMCELLYTTERRTCFIEPGRKKMNRRRRDNNDHVFISEKSQCIRCVLPRQSFTPFHPAMLSDLETEMENVGCSSDFHQRATITSTWSILTQRWGSRDKWQAVGKRTKNPRSEPSCFHACMSFAIFRHED